MSASGEDLLGYFCGSLFAAFAPHSSGDEPKKRRKEKRKSKLLLGCLTCRLVDGMKLTFIHVCGHKFLLRLSLSLHPLMFDLLIFGVFHGMAGQKLLPDLIDIDA